VNNNFISEEKLSEELKLVLNGSMDERKNEEKKKNGNHSHERPPLKCQSGFR
jgi:hypothetical protein